MPQVRKVFPAASPKDGSAVSLISATNASANASSACSFIIDASPKCHYSYTLVANWLRSAAFSLDSSLATVVQLFVNKSGPQVLLTLTTPTIRKDVASQWVPPMLGSSNVRVFPEYSPRVLKSHPSLLSLRLFLPNCQTKTSLQSSKAIGDSVGQDTTLRNSGVPLSSTTTWACPPSLT